MIKNVRECGARIKLIDDGDIAAALSVVYQGTYDMYIGSGGAPEGVLAASAVASLGGQMQGRLILDTPELMNRAANLGISDFNKIYSLSEMVKSDSLFVASGLTDGAILSGIKRQKDYFSINSLVFSSGSITNLERTIKHEL